jgi:predicted HAD superfamily phosphohydrolase YqeG
MNKPFYIYVDVDETFVRSYGTKRIAMPHIIEHIKELHKQGATMYCWSSGGGDYAKSSAIEFGIDHCFTAFLPKPNITIDDMEFSQWRDLYQVHPNECHGNTLESYKRKIVGS